MSIRYKYVKLLTEGYNFSNVDEVLSAIKSNQAGVKINNSIKAASAATLLKYYFRYFFERCESLGVKEKTYGIQLLLSKSESVALLSRIVETDGFYEILKSYKKPWVKEMPAFQSLMERKTWDSTSLETLHNLEKDIQREQENHGKKSKGSGEMQDVKVLHDDGTWKLMQPTSFQGEKAAAYYTKDGKETPTE